ncbi:MAG: alkaline phosphatase family protein [Pedosphaera sp.]|nr:alkaline phosphatase family protein [Pedosphaera sp.]
MKRTAVINIVGLTGSLIGEHTPRIRDFAARGAKAVVAPAFPAVTCTAQSNYLTGATPTLHGIVGNGWYNRELAEVQFWKQSNHLVGGKKIWDELREKSALRTPHSALTQPFTCAKLFWWFNMYSSADYSITPRPMYPADGRKFFDIYSQPYSMRDEIKRDLGEFPFATFWGPAAGRKSPAGAPDAASRWIAESAKWIENKFSPTLNLIYLPHLDYNLQRHGPFLVGDDVRSLKSNAECGVRSAGSKSEPPHVGSYKINPGIVPDLRAIDDIVGGLIDFFRAREVQVVLLSEYGITNVDKSVHLNRLFRQQGWLTVKEELGLELLDAGASKVFAVADHQVAHIYLNDPSLEGRVRERIEKCDGVEAVLGKKEKAAAGIDHSRAGDLIAVAKENAWFTYYYWLDDALAPDFARTVDIHRKPGYDPAELFLDPKIPLPQLKIAWRLLQKKLGFRMLMDVIPLDASLVKGSHGRCPTHQADWPVFITERSELLQSPQLEATDVYHALLRHVLH